jgi:arylsulfatase A-like enzyme
MSVPERVEASAGVVHEMRVSLLDLMPTILDLVGMAPPQGLAGRSLLPLIRGDTIPPVVLYAERRSFESPPKSFLSGRGSSILDWPWHLLHADGMKPELYDLSSDPSEATNVSAAHRVLSDRLTRDVERWRRELVPLWRVGASETDPAALERLRALGYVQ